MPSKRKGKKSLKSSTSGPRGKTKAKSLIAGVSKSRPRKTQSSVAVNIQRKDPNRISEGPIAHKIHGKGMRFSGVQVLQKAVTTASDSQLWTGSAPAVAVTVNAIQLNPDTLNGRLAVYANSYARFVFRSITVEYEPLVATSQAGGFAMAVVNDPNYFGETSGDYTLIQDIVPSITSPFRERASITYKYDGDDLFFTEYDQTTSASVRQCVQSLILGYPSSSSLGAITMGIFRLHYVIDMFQPINTLGISLSGLSPEQKEGLRGIADQMRSSKDLKKDKVESKELKDSIRPVTLERDERSGLRAPPSTPSASSSTSSASSGVTSSSLSQGWFRA